MPYLASVSLERSVISTFSISVRVFALSPYPAVNPEDEYALAWLTGTETFTGMETDSKILSPPVLGNV
jgi:hypothetical protein